MPQSPITPFSGIFISYRRDDTAGHTGRLFENLAAHFGEAQIFMDIDTIEPGADFVEVIEKAVGSCEIVIAVIGQRWLSSGDGTSRRLDNPNDFVRLEIATALKRGVRLIPVLVQKATMPAPQDLPENIATLSRRNATELSDGRWRYDVAKLITFLERVLKEREEARREAEERAKNEAAQAAARQAQAGSQLGEDKAKRVAEEEKQLRPAEEAAPKRNAEQALQASREGKPAADSSNRTRLLVVIASGALAAIVFIIWISQRPDGEKQSVTTQQLAPATSAPTTNAAQPPPGMVYVPGGEFTLGRDDGDEYERPAHRQTLKAFFIDTYEVTCSDYEKFVREDSHPPPQGWSTAACPEGAARKPVTGVTWGSAVAFCHWRGKKLPTEQEWEFAARGTDGRRYPWGNDWRVGMANADRPSGRLVDVGSYPEGKSPFGAFDMVGNAWEWTTADLTAYPGGKLPEQPDTGTKVLRGGTYLSKRHEATATYRLGWKASGASNYATTGFRCVKDAAESAGQR